MGILGIYASQISGHLNVYAYESIQTVTVGSGGSASINFTSIPSTYKHLQIRMRTKTTNTLDINFRFNGDSGNNYSSHGFYGDGGGGSLSAITAYIGTSSGYIGYSPSTQGASILDVFDYSNTNKNKLVRTQHGNDNNGSGYIMINSSEWMSSAAITSMEILVASGTFEQNSKFSLYGVKG